MYCILYKYVVQLVHTAESKLESCQSKGSCWLWKWFLLSHFDTYWLEVESRTQGSRPRQRTQKNPRPRTALQTLSRPRTGMLEAKAKDQEHSCKCSPKKKKKKKKKKRSSKEFFRQSPIYWRSQNFWLGGGPKPQITCNDVIKNFQNRNFLWNKDIVGCKSWNRCRVALNQDFAKKEHLNE